jgi:hypothetical protein
VPKPHISASLSGPSFYLNSTEIQTLHRTSRFQVRSGTSFALLIQRETHLSQKAGVRHEEQA